MAFTDSALFQSITLRVGPDCAAASWRARFAVARAYKLRAAGRCNGGRISFVLGVLLPALPTESIRWRRERRTDCTGAA
jgi:hypothetical protein